jgi:hypothetical protein
LRCLKTYNRIRIKNDGVRRVLIKFYAAVMIEKNRYRLGEYQITEYEDGSLWWNAHHGFAEQQSGRCFTYEDILMFGEFIDKEDGFLKREFLQGLKKLSIWNKTKL